MHPTSSWCCLGNVKTAKGMQNKFDIKTTKKLLNNLNVLIDLCGCNSKKESMKEELLLTHTASDYTTTKTGDLVFFGGGGQGSQCILPPRGAARAM